MACDPGNEQEVPERGGGSQEPQATAERFHRIAVELARECAGNLGAMAVRGFQDWRQPGKDSGARHAMLLFQTGQHESWRLGAAHLITCWGFGSWGYERMSVVLHW